MRQGETADGMYFLSSGAAEVRFADGTARLGRGEFFGELALLNRQRRSADVVALTYCQFLRLSEEDFRTFLDTHPALREQLHRVAQGRQRVVAATP